MSRLLEVRPGILQTDTPAPISIPVHRKRGPAKLNERMKEETLKMAEQYQGFSSQHLSRNRSRYEN